MVGECTKVKTQTELADNVNRERAQNVLVPLGQSIDT